MNNEQIAQASTAMIIAQQGKQIKKLQKENEDLKGRNLNLEDSYKNVIKVNNEYVIRNSNLRKENEKLKAELEKERSVVDKIENCLDVFSISNLSRKNLLTIARQRQRERNDD